jgi:hypothetical protein
MLAARATKSHRQSRCQCAGGRHSGGPRRCAGCCKNAHTSARTICTGVQVDGAAAGHGVAGFFNNAHTAVVRRVKNIMTDERTHAVFARFLGLPVAPLPGGGGSGGGGAVATGGASPQPPRAVELAEHAQALPVADNADTDDEAEPLGARSWPPRPPGPPSSASSGLPPHGDESRATASTGDLAAAGGSPQGSPVRSGGQGHGPLEASALNALPLGAGTSGAAAAGPGSIAGNTGEGVAMAAAFQDSVQGKCLPDDNPFGETGGSGGVQPDLLASDFAELSASGKAPTPPPGAPAGGIEDPVDLRHGDLLSLGGLGLGSNGKRAEAPAAAAAADPFVGFDSNESNRGDEWSDSALERPSLL